MYLIHCDYKRARKLALSPIQPNRLGKCIHEFRAEEYKTSICPERTFDSSSHLHSALLLSAGDALPRLQATPRYLLSSIIATQLKQLPACNDRLKGERIVEAEGP